MATYGWLTMATMSGKYCVHWKKANLSVSDKL